MQGGCVTNIRPDVTVAVMSYNNSAYIEQTIESVLAQEGASLELFVFDDGSTDQTLDVLQRYTSDARFSYEVNPNNLGMMGNHNRCLRAGTGRFVVVLGSDDLLYPGHLASQVAALDLHPESDLVYTQCQWIDETGVVTQQPVHPGHRLCSYFGRRDEVVDLLSFDNYITPSAVMFRRAVLEHVQLADGSVYRPDLVAGGWELWTRIARHNPDFVFLRQRTVGSRVHGGQISQSFYSSSKPLLEHTEILELNLACPEVLPRLRAKASLIWDLYLRRQSQYSHDERSQIEDRASAIHAALFAPEITKQIPLPLVSVCVASYNHEAYIGEALESILAQSYSNIEILVIDDASTDKSAEVIESYARRYPGRFRTVVLSVNEGISRASNRLFAMAQGEFVALLGSDDRMLQQRIERQVAYLLENPDCVGVFTNIAVIDAQGRRPVNPTGWEGLFNQPIIHLRRQLLTGNFLNAPSAMVRRNDLIEAGGYDPLLRYVQDYDLWGRLLLRGELIRLHECLTEYRVHGSNLSVFDQDGPSFSARCETVETIVRFVRTWPLETVLARAPLVGEERARGLLELAGVLELVDRKFLGKPSLASAYAYQLTLEAGQQLPNLAVSAKRHLERCLNEGFHAQWRPFAWFDGSTPDWFADYGRSFGAPARARKLSHWLEARLPTPIQNQLINDYLCQHAGGPRFGILVLDLQGNTPQLMKTIRSLSLERGLYATLKIVVFTTVNVPLTKPDTKLHFVSVKPDNYIAAINEVIRTADFDWFMLVNAGEEFTACGLMIAALELVDSDGCRAVYGDELYRTVDGELGAAFRPAFNLDMLLSLPTVMARHWLFCREIVVEAGGFDARLVSALEFDLLLRLIERGGMAGFGHVDEPLLITTAPVLIGSADEQAALLAHLERRGYNEAQLLPSMPGRYRIHYGHREQPLVSIIVPTKDQLPVLQRCVESLLEKTAYVNYELLIVDNASETQEAKAWLAGVEQMGDDKVRVLRYPFPFNYSAINNMAARAARGEYLVLLNNDTAVISETWLDELLNHALRPEVGIVGAKLLYPDGKIQHAGVVLGLRGPADHPFIGESMDAPGYMQRLQVDQNYSAVTAACLMIRKSIYEEVGGLDEERFKVSYNDVDLCLKVREAGHLIVWTPHSVVMHEGSVSQKRIDPQAAEAKQKRFAGEQDAMYEKWLPALACDPAYNRNLSLNGRAFELEPDVQLTWRPLTWRPLPVVLAHPADPWGCGNYRVIRPFKALSEAGKVEGMLSVGLLQVVDLERYDPDVIVLQRQIGDERLDAMRRIKAFSKAFKVYELDDYLPNLPMKNQHREHMPKDILRSLRRGLGYVDRFVVSTEALAEAFSGLHGDIHVAPNCLPTEWWGNLTSRRCRGQKPRVGWAGGVSHTGDLQLIIDVVKALAREVEWVFFGMCPAEIAPYVTENHPGVEIDLYPKALARLDLDLAIAPVEQNLFNECKSNLRLLEYGACGFPVVCSDVRCYQGDLPVTRVKNRFKDWVDAIRMHISDLDASAKQGDLLRQRVSAEWMLDGNNLQRWSQAWLSNI